jgi:hypothetical protein
MWAEHFVYSAAIAVIAGMFFYHFTGRDPSWIIILLSLAPDIDHVALILRQFRVFIRLHGYLFNSGAFHNLASMFILGFVIAYVLYCFGIPLLDALIFSIIGFGAHLVEDALVYPAGYAYLWPLVSAKTGLGWLTVAFDEEQYTAVTDFFHIANTEVLLVGVVLLIFAVLIRTVVESDVSWIRWYMPWKYSGKVKRYRSN